MKTSLGKTLFDFVWTPQDALMALKPPQRYGRVEVALSDGIVDGVIERILGMTWDRNPEEFNVDVPVGPITPDPVATSYTLRISVDVDLMKYSEEERADIGVKVCA